VTDESPGINREIIAGWVRNVRYKTIMRVKPAEATQALQAHQDRFLGDPRRIPFLASVRAAQGDTEGAKKLYKEAIDQHTEAWPPYYNLGRLEMADGRYQEAQAVMMRYPAFSKAPAGSNRVEISQVANYMGSLLFWRGAYEEARPFFELSAGLQTGSEGGLASAVRLNLIDRNLRAAAQYSLMRAKHYNSTYAYRDYMSLLHLLGYGEVAWPLFEALLKKSEAPHAWTSAFVGHRLQGLSDEEIVDWLKQEQIRSAPHPYISLPARYALMALTIDRPPNHNVPALIAELSQNYQTYVYASGHVTSPSGVVLGPSRYNGFNLNRPEPGTKVEPELAFFARGYNALKEKDYSGARDVFVERARYYLSGEGTLGSYALPYFAWASVKSGPMEAMETYLSAQDVQGSLDEEPVGFDYYLARAFVAAGQRQHDQALSFLHRAFNARPHTEMRPIFSWYQIVEACEWLYEDSGDGRYRDLALKWAKDYQVIQPMFGWAYAVEAKYAETGDVRSRALGITLYLDRRSARIAPIGEAEKREALEWLEDNNPFLKPPPREGGGEPI